MKRSIQVEIAGQTLSIRSDEGPEYVRLLAEYVDGCIRDIAPGPRSPANFHLSRVALLAAIRIADELFREKYLHARFRADVDDRLAALRRTIEDHARCLDALSEPSSHEESP